MTSDQSKFEHLAGLCDSLAQNASTPEQRESLLDLARKWRRWRLAKNFTKLLRETLFATRSPRG